MSNSLYARAHCCFVHDADPMRMALYRLLPGESVSLALPKPALLFPLCMAPTQVLLPSGAYESSNAYRVLIMPSRARFALAAEASPSDVLVLLVDAALLDRVARDYLIDGATLRALLSAVSSVPRSNWLNELAHRLLFERRIAGVVHNVATAFLEQEILKELLYADRDPRCLRLRNGLDLDGQNFARIGSTVRRAMVYIEANLCRSISVAEVGRNVGASASNLLRCFKGELGMSPRQYLRDRRLQEAHSLLSTGRYRVSEVAGLLGYETLSSFSRAFQQRFGDSPMRARRGQAPNRLNTPTRRAVAKRGRAREA